MTEYIFKKHDNIGVNSAEEDEKYLYECFTDTGELDILKDIEDKRFMVIGRTGSGKTALFKYFKRINEDCIFIDANLSGFSYTERTTILSDLSEKGINLTPYLKFLWMHVLLIEIIQAVIPIDQKESWLSWLFDCFNQNTSKENIAREYLKAHQDEFFLDTFEKTRKITEEFSQAYKQVHESDIQARGSIGVVDSHVNYSTGSSSSGSSSNQESYSIEKRGIEIVSKNLASKIGVIPEVINKILQNKSKYIHIVIDKLDETTTNDDFRYQSLRGLVDAAKELNHSANNLKIAVSLRVDLLDCIFRKVKVTGQQIEKYKPLFLSLNWNKDKLIELAERRINKLLKKKYEPKSSILFSQLFCSEMHVSSSKKIATDDYMIERTWDRPRDIIDFINKCIELSEGRSEITNEVILRAEQQYSKERYTSLKEEWDQTIPAVGHMLDLLHGLNSPFRVKDIGEEKIMGTSENSS